MGNVTSFPRETYACDKVLSLIRECEKSKCIILTNAGNAWIGHEMSERDIGLSESDRNLRVV